MSTDTFLDQMDEFVEINPKYGSPFAPEKVNKYTAKVDRVTLFSFDSDRAALDEFTSLNRKSLLIFGGFGLGREKPGHGRSGWRSIWKPMRCTPARKLFQENLLNEQKVAIIFTEICIL